MKTQQPCGICAYSVLLHPVATEFQFLCYSGSCMGFK